MLRHGFLVYEAMVTPDRPWLFYFREDKNMKREQDLIYMACRVIH